MAQVEEDFSFTVENDRGEAVRFSGNAQEYTLDRSGMSQPLALNFGTVRYARRLEPQAMVRIFVDHSSLEIFCDDGKTVFTTRFFLQGPLTLSIQGMRGTWYPLRKAVWNGRSPCITPENVI